MRKCILFLIFIFLFVSCEDVYVNDDNIFCELEKTEYQVNEPITISLFGNCKSSDEVKFILIGISLMGINNYENNSPKMIVNTKKEKVEKEESCSYYYIFQPENEKPVEDFSDTVVIQIPYPGEYILKIRYQFESNSRIYGGTKTFNNEISIVSIS
ncbi:MAG: hypothetical protein K5866_01485 [Treponema sp.]|nr:hypothetical protein [Treponema sp.]